MIHARNLGDVLCENIKSLEMIQVNVMLRPSNENPHKSCNDASRARIDFQVSLTADVCVLIVSHGLSFTRIRPCLTT